LHCLLCAIWQFSLALTLEASNFTTTVENVIHNGSLICSDSNNSSCVQSNKKPRKTSDGHDYFSKFNHFVSDNKTVLYRSAIVLCSLTGLVTMFFIVKAVRLRGRRKTRKYGVLATSNDKVEMQRLEMSDEDDEDMTVFDMNGQSIRK